MPIERYLDISLVVAGAPVLLVLGVPASGYAVAAGTWTLVALLGVAVDRQVEVVTRAAPMAQLVRQISLKLSYRLIRIVALGTGSILVVRGVGRADVLTTALVLALAFTIQLVCAAPLRGPRPHAGRLHADEAGPGAQPTIKVLPKE